MAFDLKNLRLYTVLSACVSIIPMHAFAADAQPGQAAPNIELHLDALDNVNSPPAAVQQQPAPPAAVMPDAAAAQPAAATPRLIWNVGPPGHIIETPAKAEKPVHKKHPKKKKPEAAAQKIEQPETPVIHEPVKPKPVRHAAPPNLPAPMPKEQPKPPVQPVAPAPVPPVSKPVPAPVAPVMPPTPAPTAVPSVPTPPASKALPAPAPTAPVVQPQPNLPPAPPPVVQPQPSLPPAPTPVAQPQPSLPPAPPAVSAPALPTPAPLPPAPKPLPPAPAAESSEGPVINMPVVTHEPAKETTAPAAAPPPAQPPTPPAASSQPLIPTPPSPNSTALPQPAVAVPPPPALVPQKAPDESPAVSATNKALVEPTPEPTPTTSAGKGSNAPALSIAFKSTETSVPLSMQSQLDDVAKQLTHNDNLRVTLVSYASVVGDQASTARRISLSRALSVRSYLIDAGVNNLRINVQAEGDKNPGGDPDRVDLVVQQADAK